MAIDTRRATRNCSARRRITSGCTSPRWATYRDARSRSSSAARAPTSSTRTASATWTCSAGCSRCRSATRTARSSARPRSSRCASCRTTRTGRSRTRPRPSSPRGSPSSRRRASTARSSSRAAPRRSSRPGSWRASTTPPTASRCGARSSRARSPTTARRWARSRSPASRRSARPSSRSSTACATSRTPTATAASTARRRGECTLACADEVAETIEQEGPETVAMVIMEPVQNSGGTFTPHPEYHRRVREICDAYGVLQVADEVICGFGRLGEWFGCQRYGYEPDLITCAKGLTSGYASLGARADLRSRGRAVRRARRVLPARHHVRRASDGDRDRAAPTST